ncbi:glycosyltransferase family 4 protein [uncultured Serinicoccus sp.]|uniref:glycosyltransferase family 4 protein n=1 Tax=uncultured Serinicoccus sp. TaxID=735514 RepID=UPI00262CAFE7|nr:glycosyltransferase family 4 protein [uncultured Serinicoccus sp.]
MTSTSARERGPSRALILPGDLAGPSGGNHYNDRVVRELDARGLAVAVERLPGAWPRPAEPDRSALREALGRYTDVVVDGIIGSAAPEELAWARAHGVRVAVLVHLPLPAEGGTSAPERRLLEETERAALHAADTVVATSDWARDDLLRRYGLAGVRSVPPGVDLAPPAAGSTPPHLLLLGAVTARKNPLVLLDALRTLMDRPWTASLVGPPGPDEGYVATVRERSAELEGRVRALGPCRGEDLEEIWGATDLLTLPSRAETYGMVVTEALAHGIPALVPARTGAVEALHGSGERDGLPPAGATVDGADPQAWSTALARWLDDEGLRRAWRAGASAHRDRLRGWATTATDFTRALRW